MKQIQVVVLNEAHNNPAGMQLFLAKLTQRGHAIKSADDLQQLYNQCVYPAQPRTPEAIQALAAMPHGTIKRFAPITIAIVGASRRFLAQARTHQVGIDYVSASLQYSDYSGEGQFVVPYAILQRDEQIKKECEGLRRDKFASSYYLSQCQCAMDVYKDIAEATDNDTAGYAAPQGLRNILIMQGNHQSWEYFIRMRGCNRNTVETQYVTMLIWKALLGTRDGEDLFAFAGPDCVYGSCREGKMCCGTKLENVMVEHTMAANKVSLPEAVIQYKWPLLRVVQ